MGTPKTPFQVQDSTMHSQQAKSDSAQTAYSNQLAAYQAALQQQIDAENSYGDALKKYGETWPLSVFRKDHPTANALSPNAMYSGLMKAIEWGVQNGHLAIPQQSAPMVMQPPQQAATVPQQTVPWVNDVEEQRKKAAGIWMPPTQ